MLSQPPLELVWTHGPGFVMILELSWGMLWAQMEVGTFSQDPSGLKQTHPTLKQKGLCLSLHRALLTGSGSETKVRTPPQIKEQEDSTLLGPSQPRVSPGFLSQKTESGNGLEPIALGSWAGQALGD